MNKTLIGLSGEMGSGKGTIAHYLVDRYGFAPFRMSDMLRDIVDRLHVEQSRENISKTSKMIRDTFGEDIMSRVVAQDAQKATTHVVIDGIRRMEDIEHLQHLENFILVYIEVDERVRYERLVLRNENKGDAEKTFEEFQKEQQMEADSRITELRDRADIVINNDGDITKLYSRVDSLINNTEEKSGLGVIKNI